MYSNDPQAKCGPLTSRPNEPLNEIADGILNTVERIENQISVINDRLFGANVCTPGNVPVPPCTLESRLMNAVSKLQVISKYLECIQARL